MLFTISGPSAVGKDTVIDAVIKLYPKVKKVVTHTTRKPRHMEKQGIDYYFVSPEKFDALKKKKYFAETKTIFKEKYGLSNNELLKAIKSEGPVIANIDVLGAIEISERHPETIGIILLPKSLKEIKYRLAERGPIEPSRLARVKMELKKQNFFDYRILNKEWNKTAEQIVQIIRKHLRIDPS